MNWTSNEMPRRPAAPIPLLALGKNGSDSDGLGFHVVVAIRIIILAALIANGRIGYRRRVQFAGSGPMAIAPNSTSS